MNCYVLPEWNEKRQSWVSELDSKQANCFTRELTDNKTKFERWTVQSLLAGAEKMKFAFVQRADKEGNSHRVVGSHMTSTKNFSLELGLNLQNCWATLLAVVEEVSSRDETVGQFMYLKDLNQQPTYRLYKMIEDEQEIDGGDLDVEDEN